MYETELNGLRRKIHEQTYASEQLLLRDISTSIGEFVFANAWKIKLSDIPKIGSVLNTEISIGIVDNE